MKKSNVNKTFLSASFTQRMLSQFLLGLLLTGLFSILVMGQGLSSSFRSGEIVVSFRPEADISAFNERYGMRVKEQLLGTNDYLLAWVTGHPVVAKLALIRHDPGVIFACPNFIYQNAEVAQRSQAFIDQRSQAFIDQRSQAFIDGRSPVNFYGQPSVLRLHLTEAHQITQGLGVRVAVIDTGIDFSHPLFAGRLNIQNFDFVDNDIDPQDEPGGAGFGHGTFIAGLIALTAPGAIIMPIRAFDRDGTGSSFNIAKAIRFAVDQKAQVINMSFGLLEQDSLLSAALGNVSSKAFMVAAAGNDDINGLHFPAQRKSLTFAVTSTDAHDRKAQFANYNRDARVSAPGVGLFSAYPGGRWATWSGTSFSTALVTGEAALLYYLHPNLDRVTMNYILMYSGVNIDALNPGYTGLLGRVRIDFLAMVNLSLAFRRK